jgi:hypothetical protein
VAIAASKARPHDELVDRSVECFILANRYAVLLEGRFSYVKGTAETSIQLLRSGHRNAMSRPSLF